MNQALSGTEFAIKYPDTKKLEGGQKNNGTAWSD
jgi:hypothetical protein